MGKLIGLDAVLRHKIKPHLGFLLLMLAYILVPLSLDTFGRYGMVDDPAYAWTVGKYITTGKYVWSGWNAMSLVGQIWLAVPLVKLAGLSYGLLRIITLFLGMVYLTSLYLLMLNTGCRATHSALITASLYVCPFFFPLLFTFMTDVPSLTFGMLGLLLQVMAIRHGRISLLLAGGVCTAFSILIRQNGIFWAPALLMYLLFEETNTRRRYLPWAFLVLIVNLVVLIAYSKWAKANGMETYSLVSLQVFKPRMLLSFLFVSLGSIGIAILPCILGGMIYMIRSQQQSPRRIALLFGVVGLALAGIAATMDFESIEHWVPYTHLSIFSKYGGFYDSLVGDGQPIALGLITRIILTVICMFVGGLAAGMVMHRLGGLAAQAYSGILKNQRRLVWTRRVSLGAAAIISVSLPPMAIFQYKVMESLRGFVHLLRSRETGRSADMSLTADQIASNILAYRIWLILLAFLAIALWILYARLKSPKLAIPDGSPVPKSGPSLHRLLYWAAAMQTLGIFTIHGLYDRYFLPVIPIILLFIFRSVPMDKYRRLPATIAIVLFGVMSWGITHDMMAWKQTVRSLTNQCMAAGVRPTDIDGGFGFDTDHANLPFAPPSQRQRLAQNDGNMAFFPQMTGLYAVTYRVLPGYEPVRSASYLSVVPPRLNTLYAVRRVEEPSH